MKANANISEMKTQPSPNILGSRERTSPAAKLPSFFKRWSGARAMLALLFLAISTGITLADNVRWQGWNYGQDLPYCIGDGDTGFEYVRVANRSSQFKEVFNITIYDSNGNRLTGWTGWVLMPSQSFDFNLGFHKYPGWATITVTQRERARDY